MSLFIASLNSGSNGNCYYVGNSNEAVLVDAGISYREIDKRLKRLCLDVEKIKAVFISHEHTDHIKGVETLATRLHIPVYITPRTLRNSRLKFGSGTIRSFQPDVPVTIGALSVSAFSKFHDAADPHSFVIYNENVRVGVFTDIGAVCPNVIRYFKTCDAVFLESNYDDEMLEKGSYPYHLKRRIKGGRGHISNSEAYKLFVEHRPPNMSHLLLSHLSHHNNDPVLVENLFNKSNGNVNIVVTSRFQESSIYEITRKGGNGLMVGANIGTTTSSRRTFIEKKLKSTMNEHQLSLF
ncbi:MAG TPA: MBL fold metallo-hydrolase [Cytophagaceae bacterium]|jgi:phosphoribosyl 1,2-cyclic phosphodiesterase